VPVEGRVGVSPQPPSNPVLIYDATCGFCSRWVDRIKVWDRKCAITYLPLQDARAANVSGCRIQDLGQAVHLVRPDGAVFAGAAAIRELFSFLPRDRLAGQVMDLPGVMPVAARLYACLARRFGPVS
jgi:predicted DCC family thiol-disulfide oxidoreductase YuxK